MRIILVIIVFILNAASVLHHPRCFLPFSSILKHLGIAAHWVTTAVVSVPSSGLYLLITTTDPTGITAGEICSKQEGTPQKYQPFKRSDCSLCCEQTY